VATPTTGVAAPASGRAGRERLVVGRPCERHAARVTDRGRLPPLGLIAIGHA
ncbi:hypothetical protein B296_00055778, partial [Ensete ventricosum]